MPRTCLEAVEVRLRARVAVDRDELALAGEILGEERRVTAGAERRVDDGLARLHAQELAHLVGEDGDVVSVRGRQDVRQHLRRSPFDCAQALGPRAGVPELEVVVGARDDDVALEIRVAGEDGRDEDPALLVDVRLGRPREEEALELARAPRERVERGDPGLDGHDPRLPRVDGDDSVETARENDALAELVAKASRQREPALLVDRVLVGRR